MMKKFLFFIMLLVFLIYIVSKNNLIFAQTLKIEYVGNVLSSASDVAILGDYAYVSRGFDGLSIVDISDPENPLALGTVSKSNCRFDAVGIREATAYSTQSYYICRPNSSLEAVDVTNPLNPILYPPENVYGIGAAVEMDISDHYAYLTLNGGGLWIYDLANPTNPELRGIYNPGSHSVFEDVKVINGIAYIADLTGYFFVVDVTNPVNPITLDYTTFYANP